VLSVNHVDSVVVGDKFLEFFFEVLELWVGLVESLQRLINLSLP